MALHSHDFVEAYTGLTGFGMDRETDEASLIVYLQKFSDDRFMEVMRKRLTDEEIEELFQVMSRLLRRHLNDEEYHELFLKEPHEH
ncbi:MAG: cytoplasmic protein [Proteobacteria bacterium]|nr:cytoplasmic protein [Pseudomonadota bacterium]